MNSSGLYDAFRRDVVDTAQPYLWSAKEVWQYMGEAQRMFVRLTGGVADALSPHTEIQALKDEPWADHSPLILRFMRLTRRSDGRDVQIINGNGPVGSAASDYGRPMSMGISTTPGPVSHAIIGLQRGKIRWTRPPVADDIIDAQVFRLPCTIVDGPDQEIEDVDEQHHWHLLGYMKALAYAKADADTFNPQAARENEEIFRNYCLTVKAEWERYKHKPRVVAYGGL